jgi:P-type E1-E2 ATPase
MKLVLFDIDGTLLNTGVSGIQSAKQAIKNFYGNVLYVALNRELVGIILLEDEVRPEAKETVEKLKSLGVKEIVMLTGDSEKVAQRVSEEVGTTSFHANLFPEEKVKYVKKYLNKKSKVVMVGDGVNDAAALAASDIGIAMGAAGADTAVEASDIALMKNDFSKVAEAFELSKKVNRISRQDFWIWGILNSAGLFLVFSKIIGPEGAALFNFVTDFIPLLNSVRMFTYRGSKNR